MQHLRPHFASMSRGRAHTTITAEGATHTRFASSDDESLDDVNSPATVEEEEEQPCFLEALPDAILQHTLAFTTDASVVRRPLAAAVLPPAHPPAASRATRGKYHRAVHVQRTRRSCALAKAGG